MKMTMTTLPKEGEFYHRCQHSVQHGASSLDVLAATTNTRSRVLAPAELNGHCLGVNKVGTIGYAGKLDRHSPTISANPRLSQLVRISEISMPGATAAANSNTCLLPPLVPSSSCSFSQPQLIPAVNGVTYIPEPSPSEMPVQNTATLSATTVYHPYPSPPYSAPINSSFKNLFSSDTSVQLGHPSFLNFPASVPSEAPHKPYPPLELQSSVTSMVSQPQVFAPFVPKPEPSSPCSCLHSPAASYWSNHFKHDVSAPPVPIAQSSHTGSSNGKSPLSETPSSDTVDLQDEILDDEIAWFANVAADIDDEILDDEIAEIANVLAAIDDVVADIDDVLADSDDVAGIDCSNMP